MGPSPHVGGFTPLWGARRPAGSTTLTHPPPGLIQHTAMQTTLSELLLVAALMAVLLVCGRA